MINNIKGLLGFFLQQQAAVAAGSYPLVSQFHSQRSRERAHPIQRSCATCLVWFTSRCQPSLCLELQLLPLSSALSSNPRQRRWEPFLGCRPW